MRGQTLRQLVGLLIGGVLLLLLFGIYSVIAAVPDAEPFGYGASGSGLVYLACGLGVLAVLLLRLFVAWQRLGAHTDGEWQGHLPQADPRRYRLILVTCGWAGAFLVILSIARGWDWKALLPGSIILLFACGVTYRLARPQSPAS